MIILDGDDQLRSLPYFKASSELVVYLSKMCRMISPKIWCWKSYDGIGMSYLCFRCLHGRGIDMELMDTIPW